MVECANCGTEMIRRSKFHPDFAELEGYVWTCPKCGREERGMLGDQSITVLKEGRSKHG